MRAIQALAEQGEWTRLDELSECFFPAMAAFKKLTESAQIVSDNRKTLVEIQQMLQSTILLCSNRMEQIAPLISALKGTPTTTDKP